uniref:Uncharacterized protein n=1 Tax=Rhizophora mucronata TaxID=61149 RepID=A0A2P2KUT3_RHIMU
MYITIIHLNIPQFFGRQNSTLTKLEEHTIPDKQRLGDHCFGKRIPVFFHYYL